MTFTRLLQDNRAGALRPERLIAAFLFFSFSSVAQVPPSLNCVEDGGNDDYLTWSYPPGACDTFVVWKSIGSSAGPYVPADTIYGPGVFRDTIYSDTFVVWYYLTCLSNPFITSDTVDNIDPVTPDITSVTVTGNDVVISWEKSPSPETWVYIVYWDNGAGLVPVDTVTGLTSLHFGSSPSSKSETYYIAAVDSCWNRGIISLLPHSTILLSISSVDSCAREVALVWNQYINWKDGVDDYQVMVNVNGGGYAVVSPSQHTALSYVVGNLVDGDSLCFRINALEKNGTASSFSNEVCLVMNLVEPVAYMHLLNLTVTGQNSVGLEFLSDTLADIKNIKVTRSRNGSGYVNIASLPAGSTVYNDFTADPGDSRLRYQVVAVDVCDAERPSSAVDAVFLEGEPENLMNKLQWNNITYGGIQSSQVTYELHRRVDGAWDTAIASLPDTIPLAYDDDVTGIVSNSGKYYYLACALYSESITGQARQSCSNLLEIGQPLKIQIPTAFLPHAVNPLNREFKPVIAFVDIASYTMQIFNRWGEMIYETYEQDQGWDGRYKNELLPAGVYVYNIRLVDSAGFEIVRKGTVVLVR